VHSASDLEAVLLAAPSAHKSTGPTNEAATGTVIETYRTSLNDFIRTQQQRLRNRQTKRFGGLEVDDQIKFRGLLDCYVARFCALDDSVNENRRVTYKPYDTGPVRDQAAIACRFLERGHHRKPVPKSEIREPLPMDIAHRIGKSNQRIRARCDYRRKTVLILNALTMRVGVVSRLRND
jgi:hypothetical protein